MGKVSKCIFEEPWVGRCYKPVTEGGLCCESHSREKCSVCGEQATTRCQASIGVMCGVPLCDRCGHGQMCLEHATEGPLMVIAALLGRGPRPSVFSTWETLNEEAAKMKKITTKLRERDWGRLSMAAYDAACLKRDVREG